MYNWRDNNHQALALLHQTSGLLHSDLPDDEIRYLVESSELAEENLYLASNDEDFRRIPDVTLWIP